MPREGVRQKMARSPAATLRAVLGRGGRRGGSITLRVNARVVGIGGGTARAVGVDVDLVVVGATTLVIERLARDETIDDAVGSRELRPGDDAPAFADPELVDRAEHER